MPGPDTEKDRDERLRAALRENLKRRKAQARARKANPPAAEEAAAPESVDPDER